MNADNTQHDAAADFINACEEKLAEAEIERQRVEDEQKQALYRKQAEEQQKREQEARYKRLHGLVVQLEAYKHNDSLRTSIVADDYGYKVHVEINGESSTVAVEFAPAWRGNRTAILVGRYGSKRRFPTLTKGGYSFDKIRAAIIEEASIDIQKKKEQNKIARIGEQSEEIRKRLIAEFALPEYTDVIARSSYLHPTSQLPMVGLRFTFTCTETKAHSILEALSKLGVLKK